MGKPWPVRSEEGTLEHVENNVWEECVGKCLGDHVSDWVFKEEGSQRNEQGGMMDGEGLYGSGLISQQSNQVIQKREKRWRGV